MILFNVHKVKVIFLLIITMLVTSAYLLVPMNARVAYAAPSNAYDGVTYWPVENGSKLGGSGGHDWSAPIGTPVFAVRDGIVVTSMDSTTVVDHSSGSTAYGRYVVIYHPELPAGYKNITYAHFSKRLVEKGQVVKAGQRVGLSGESGNTYGAHLHANFDNNWNNIVDADPNNPNVSVIAWLHSVNAIEPKDGSVTPNTTFINIPDDPTKPLPKIEVDKTNLNNAETDLKKTEEEYSNVQGSLVTTKALIKVRAEDVRTKTVVETEKNKNVMLAEKTIAAFARDNYTDNTSEISRTLAIAAGGPGTLTDMSREEQTLERQSFMSAEEAVKTKTEAEDAYQNRKDATDQYISLVEEKNVLEKSIENISKKVLVAKKKYAQELKEYNAQALLLGGGITIASDSTQKTINPKDCPNTSPAQFLRDGAAQYGIKRLCEESVQKAPTVQAAKAILYAFNHIGAPYACGGAGRTEPNSFDCSSFVSRSYSEGAGMSNVGVSNTVAMTRPVANWLTPVEENGIKPGDLVFFAQQGTNGDGGSGHVVMALANGFLIDTGACGDGVRIQKLDLHPNWTQYDGAYRVVN